MQPTRTLTTPRAGEILLNETELKQMQSIVAYLKSNYQSADPEAVSIAKELLRQHDCLRSSKHDLSVSLVLDFLCDFYTSRNIELPDEDQLLTFVREITRKLSIKEFKHASEKIVAEYRSYWRTPPSVSDFLSAAKSCPRDENRALIEALKIYVEMADLYKK